MKFVKRLIRGLTEFHVEMFFYCIFGVIVLFLIGDVVYVFLTKQTS